MKHIAWLNVILISQAAFCSTAPENTIDYDAMYLGCMQKQGPINNAAVYSCSDFVSDQAKSEINKLYKIISEKIKARNSGDGMKFDQAQKNWLNYRNAHCELSGSYVGSPMYSYCPMKLNISRAYELREFAN